MQHHLNNKTSYNTTMSNNKSIGLDQQKQSTSAKYKCSQVFGTNQSSDVQDEDIISCLKYDPSGKYLCLGDNAGRVIIFQDRYINNKKSKNYQGKLQVQNGESQGNNEETNQRYDYYAEFQSHVRQLDPLKGIQSSQGIVDITWLRPQGKYLKLITSNSKIIKSWKAHEKVDKKILKSAKKQLCMPRLSRGEPNFSASQQYNFPAYHTTQINSISHSNNQEYLLSTDEQQSFFWSLQKPVKPYIVNSIAACRKTSTNELAITCSKMHPRSDSIFVYGMNRCELGVCDMRVSGHKGKVIDFGVQARSMKNFFMDMVATIGSAQFMQNGKYIVSRQYLSTKIWDITNTKKPLHNICIQQSLKSQLANLFQNNCLYDKFKVSTSYDSTTILTGNYNNCFHLLNPENGSNTQYQLNFQKNTIKRQIKPHKSIKIQKMDFKRKTSILASHPFKSQIAVAALNNFFIYQANH